MMEPSYYPNCPPQGRPGEYHLIFDLRSGRVTVSVPFAVQTPVVMMRAVIGERIRGMLESKYKGSPLTPSNCEKMESDAARIARDAGYDFQFQQVQSPVATDFVIEFR